MNKEAIIQTAILFWDDESECYIVKSPLFHRVLGAGETPEEAGRLFLELLDETYQSYRAGKLANHGKPGRPKKHKAQFHAEIDPEVKNAISMIADQMGVSQGELVEYMFAQVVAFEKMVITEKPEPEIAIKQFRSVLQTETPPQNAAYEGSPFLALAN